MHAPHALAFELCNACMSAARALVDVMLTRFDLHPNQVFRVNKSMVEWTEGRPEPTSSQSKPTSGLGEQTYV